MAGPSADRITEWEGGSLSELVAMLQAAALPVRIEVIAPGTTGSNAGEVHLLAGGLADAFAGSLRRDDAMAALQRLEGARYVIESRLPNPESGSLSEPGPHQGSLKDRPLASLMRYCEEYVLTCRLEVWRSQDRAVISYRRGEIIGTVVGGSEGSELLPEVMGWTEGSYEIILPAPVLPQMPSRGRDGARPERKRHATLPMVTAQDAKSEGQGASRADAGAKIPVSGTVAAGTAAPGGTVAALLRAGTAQPAQPAVPSSVLRASPQPAAPRSAPQPPQQVVARPPIPQPAAQAQQPASPVQPGSAAQRFAPRQPSPAAATPRPIAAAIVGPLPPEMTARGTPPVPAVLLVPAPTQLAPRPTMQGTAVPLKPAAPVQPKPAAPTAQPAPQASPKPVPLAAGPQAQPKPAPLAAQPAPQPQPKPVPLAAQPAPQPQPKPVPLAAQPAPQPQPAAQPQPKPVPLAAQPAPQPQPKPIPPAAQPAPQAQPKPVPPTAQPAAQPQPKPILLVAHPAPQAQSKPIPPAHAATPPPATPPAAQALAQAANQGETASARPLKPSPAASNDLMPASGTFEAKPKHANYLPPTTAPIQIADEPQVIATPQPSLPVVVPNRPPAPRRQRVASRKGIGDHPVRVYVLIGLAIGVGIVLAYWAYWYLPFGHH